MNNAYLVGSITIKDPIKWAEYCRQVPGTLATWQAEIVFRGKRAATLSGESQHTDIVVIRFPGIAAVNAWHSSAAYQALIPLRQQAADVTLLSYET